MTSSFCGRGQIEEKVTQSSVAVQFDKLEFILLNRQHKLHFILIFRASQFKSHMCI